MERMVKAGDNKKPRTNRKKWADDILKTIYQDHSIIGDIKVTSLGTKVILDGVVESDQQKDCVTAIVMQIEGVNKVENNLRVDWMC